MQKKQSQWLQKTQSIEVRISSVFWGSRRVDELINVASTVLLRYAHPGIWSCWGVTQYFHAGKDGLKVLGKVPCGIVDSSWHSWISGLPMNQTFHYAFLSFFFQAQNDRNDSYNPARLLGHWVNKTDRGFSLIWTAQLMFQTGNKLTCNIWNAWFKEVRKYSAVNLGIKLFLLFLLF